MNSAVDASVKPSQGGIDHDVYARRGVYYGHYRHAI